jgi:hypothetical protein
MVKDRENKTLSRILEIFWECTEMEVNRMNKIITKRMDRMFKTIIIIQIT